MTAKPVLIQGGKEVLFDDSGANVRAGALAQVLISADCKFVFKLENAKWNRDEFQTLRELGMKFPPKSESRKLLVKVWGVEKHPFVQWQDAKVHVQECAPGKDLRSYAAEGVLSFEDRLYIAIQTASLFKETNEAGSAYLDHKPKDHIYWDVDNRVIKVIDWNTAVIKSTEAERAEDFINYCQALSDILDTNPYEDSDKGAKNYRYLSHPLNWSLDLENLSHHKRLGYRSWFILALTSLTVTGKPFLQDWTELLQVFADVRDGKNSWLESIVSKHAYIPTLAKAGNVISQLLSLDFPPLEQREEAKSLADRLVKESRSAQKPGDIKESDYQGILYRLLFARLLSPSHFRTFCLFEVWWLFLVNPDQQGLCQLFVDLKPGLAWENYVKKLNEAALAFPNFKALKKLERMAVAQQNLEKLKEETDLSRKVELLRESSEADAENLDIQIMIRETIDLDGMQKRSDQHLKESGDILENTGDVDKARGELEQLRNLWEGAGIPMPEQIVNQSKIRYGKIEAEWRARHEEEILLGEMQKVLREKELSLTVAQVDEVIGKVSGKVKTRAGEEMLSKLQKLHADLSIREKQVSMLNSAADVETWRNGLAEAAEKGNLRAKEDLVNADLIGKALEKIQQGINQISSASVEKSARSYLAAQSEISKLRETLNGQEVPLRFLGQIESELPVFKDAVLRQAAENIRDLLIKRERVEADLVNAEKTWKVVSVFGEQELEVRAMAELLKSCRLIEEMKEDLARWNQLSDEMTKLPPEIRDSAYYSDLRQRVRNVLRANQLIALPPRQWADDIQSLQEQWEKEAQLGVVEREVYKKLRSVAQESVLDSAERNKLDSLYQVQKEIADNLSESENALRFEIKALQKELETVKEIIQRNKENEEHSFEYLRKLHEDIVRLRQDLGFIKSETVDKKYLRDNLDEFYANIASLLRQNPDQSNFEENEKKEQNIPSAIPGTVRINPGNQSV